MCRYEDCLNCKLPFCTVEEDLPLYDESRFKIIYSAPELIKTVTIPALSELMYKPAVLR